MTRPWARLLRISLAVFLVLSVCLVLVHWHTERASQDCGICAAHHMPGLQSSAAPTLSAPGFYAGSARTLDSISVAQTFVSSHSGRAPPAFLSSLSL